jgi:hypothetical protein
VFANMFRNQIRAQVRSEFSSLWLNLEGCLAPSARFSELTVTLLLAASS